jgi:uncharacterized membrane protein
MNEPHSKTRTVHNVRTARSGRSRWLSHALTTQRTVHRALPEEAVNALEKTVGNAERGSSGQIRLVVEAHWPLWQVKHQAPRGRALEWFSQLRVWDTEHNNGVLVYLLFAERDVEIVADRGFNSRVTAAQWEAICKAMEARFKRGEFDAGLTDGITAIGDLLREHFPADMGKNEQSDRPVFA